MGFYGIVNTAVYGFCIYRRGRRRSSVGLPSEVRRSSEHHTTHPYPPQIKYIDAFPARALPRWVPTVVVLRRPALGEWPRLRQHHWLSCPVALVARVADSPSQQVCTEAEVFTSLGRTVWTCWPGRPRVTSPITLAAQRTARWLPRARGSAEQAPAAHSPGQA